MSLIHFLNIDGMKNYNKTGNYKSYKEIMGSYKKNTFSSYNNDDCIYTGNIHVRQLDAIESIRNRYDKLEEYYDDIRYEINDLSNYYSSLSSKRESKSTKQVKSNYIKESNVFSDISKSVVGFVGRIKNINYVEKKEKLIAWVKSDWNK